MLKSQEKTVEAATERDPQFPDFLDDINQERFEYDCPHLTKDQWLRDLGDEMMEKYGYDIGK